MLFLGAQYYSRVAIVISKSINKNRLFSTSGFRANEYVRKSIDTICDGDLIQPSIASALKKLGFTTLTRVQSETITPCITNPKGLVARAKTGTGKTLAFGIPILNQIMKDNDRSSVKGIIVAPTRDLAMQIHDELHKIIKANREISNKVKIVNLIGGAPRFAQKNMLSQREVPNLAICTPGRLIDFMSDPSTARFFKSVSYQALDEADRLLDQGFKEDLVKISDILNEISVNTTTPKYKTLFYSATIDANVISFAEDLMGRDFQYIDTVDKNEAETHEKIHQSLAITNSFMDSYTGTIAYIKSKIAQDKTAKIIVFSPTTKGVEFMHELLGNHLYANKIPAKSYKFHGKLSQNQRDRVVEQFRRDRGGILIASDVGARGMDFPNVTDVVQLGITQDPSNYVHRIGRTARAGKSGRAIIFATQAELPYISRLTGSGIKFAEQYDVEAMPELSQELCDATASSLSLTDNFRENLGGMVGFYSTAAGAYRLNSEEVMKSLSELHTAFGQAGLPRVPSRALEAFRVPARVTALYFETGFKQSYGESPSYNKRSRSGEFESSNSFGGRSSGRSNYRSEESSYGGRSSYGGNSNGGRSYGDRSSSGGYNKKPRY